MDELTIPADETHTISEGESETYSSANVHGTLNVGGELTLTEESETSSESLLDDLITDIKIWTLRFTIRSAPEVPEKLPPSLDRFLRRRDRS